METRAIKLLIIALLAISAVAIFGIGIKTGYQMAYRDEHHLSQAMLNDANRKQIEADVEGFLINRFYYTGLLCPQHYSQGLFQDLGISSSKAPKGKWFDTGNNQELYDEYMKRANNRTE